MGRDPAMGVLSNVGLGLLCFWAVKSFNVYWFTSQDEQYEDFASVMIKPWGLRHEAGIKSILYDKVFAPDDLWVKKLHTATSLVSALLLTLQLNPTLRRKQLALHRLLGKVFLLLAILQYPFLWYMVCHMKLAVTVALLDAPVVACLPVFAFIGYKKIKAKDVAGHR
eukprot:TRINITY_DN339_c0_g1_i7.p3 TRINITY_DN339_c0_g1~~TRINITY_DN339_c0_g1_i7.p3  ORF type:complete len:167 (-),score=40.70 TRINITY_DN339_c0_g1_i7:1695-2195(-)